MIFGVCSMPSWCLWGLKGPPAHWHRTPFNAKILLGLLSFIFLIFKILFIYLETVGGEGQRKRESMNLQPTPR